MPLIGHPECRHRWHQSELVPERIPPFHQWVTRYLPPDPSTTPKSPAWDLVVDGCSGGPTPNAPVLAAGVLTRPMWSTVMSARESRLTSGGTALGYSGPGRGYSGPRWPAESKRTATCWRFRGRARSRTRHRLQPGVVGDVSVGPYVANHRIVFPDGRTSGVSRSSVKSSFPRDAFQKSAASIGTSML